MPKLDDHAQTRLAFAALFAALVTALRESDSELPSRFDNALGRIYAEMKHYDSQPIGALETLRWVSELLKMA